MSDLIDRQAAIDAANGAIAEYIPCLYGRYEKIPLEMALAIKRLPSAQPEIIRCKDCYLRYTACPMVVRNGNYLTFFTKDEDFCSYGKGEEVE